MAYGDSAYGVYGSLFRGLGLGVQCRQPKFIVLKYAGFQVF